MDRPGQITELQIALDEATADDPAAMAEVRRAIDDLRDERGEKLGLSAVPARQFVESSTEVGLARAMAWGTTAPGAGDRLLAIAQHDADVGHRANSGNRRAGALGWRTSRVVRMVLYEALAISAVGATAGILLGVAFVPLAEFGGLDGGPAAAGSLARGARGQSAGGAGDGRRGRKLSGMGAARLSAAEALRYE